MVDPGKAVQILCEVFAHVYGNTESFEKRQVGADLAYLTMAVITDDPAGVDLRVSTIHRRSALLKLLRDHFKADHPVWRYVILEA
jgi:hypothetical protein